MASNYPAGVTDADFADYSPEDEPDYSIPEMSREEALHMGYLPVASTEPPINPDDLPF